MALDDFGKNLLNVSGGKRKNWHVCRLSAVKLAAKGKLPRRRTGLGVAEGPQAFSSACN